MNLRLRAFCAGLDLIPFSMVDALTKRKRTRPHFSEMAFQEWQRSGFPREGQQAVERARANDFLWLRWEAISMLVSFVWMVGWLAVSFVAMLTSHSVLGVVSVLVAYIPWAVAIYIRARR